MIALDTSAVVAIAMEEPEGERFDTLIARNRTIIGTPTLLEARIVLGALMPAFADDFLEVLILRSTVQPVAFTLPMYRLAADAFLRFGKGRGHPARLRAPHKTPDHREPSLCTRRRSGSFVRGS